MPVLTRHQRQVKQAKEQERERRLEEALKVVLPLGFDRELIISAIEQLLKVYGSEELGWKAVQEDSYKVVIERILEGDSHHSDKRDDLDDKENSTEQAQIHYFDAKFCENDHEPGTDIEFYEDGDGTFTFEDDHGTSSAEVDEVPQSSSDRDGEVDRDVLPSMLDPLDDSSDSVKAEVGQKAIDVGNPDTGFLQGSLGCKIKKHNSWERVREDEADDLMLVGKQADLQERRNIFTFENDLGTSSAEVDEVLRCSSDRDGEVDRDVLPAMLDPLDDSSVSVKAEVVGQKAIDVENSNTRFLQDPLGCKIEKHNSWERVGEDEANDLMLVGKQTDLQEINNICKNLVLNTSSVLEVKKFQKETTDKQSKKESDGDENRQRSFLSPILLASATSYSHALTEDLEPGEIPATSVPVSEIQRQEMHLFFSNKNSFSEGRLAVPLGRKPCYGWLSSDEELSPREPTISTHANEVFCDHSEMAVRGNDFSERYGSGRKTEHDTNIKSSIQVGLQEKTSTEYDSMQTENEKDIRRPEGRLIQQYENLSEETVCPHERYRSDQERYRKDQERSDKEGRRSDRERSNQQRHRSGQERSDQERHGLDRERSDHGRHRSHQEGSDQERRISDRERSDRKRHRSDWERSDRERYRSDQDRYRSGHGRYRSDHERYRSDRERYRSSHRNDRVDRKHSQQPMDKHSACHEETSADILKDKYQKREHRIKSRVEKAQNPVEQTTDTYTKERFSEYQRRQGYERKPENNESRSYENRYTYNQRNETEKVRGLMEADNKHPLLHVNNFSQEAKLGTDHDCAKVRDEVVVLETCPKIYKECSSPCKKRRKWDVPPCTLDKSGWM